MTEQQINDYFTANEQLSKRTVVSYKNLYTKFDDMNKNILTQSQTNILQYIDNFDGSTNTKLAMINVVVNLRRHYKKPEEKIQTRKLQLADDYKIQKDATKKEKKEGLPTSAELIAHENRLYIDENWTGFIVTHLMRLLSTRNKDLDLKIIPANRSKRKGDPKDKNNYLIIRSNNAQVIRNNYKTFSTYGQKKNLVPSRRLNRAVHKMVAERDVVIGKDEIYLLSTLKGQPLSEDSLSKKIRSYTMDGLSETDYNKVFVSEFAGMEDKKMLERISNNRGSSLEVLLQEYHLDGS